MTGPSELIWLVNFLQILFRYCDEGLSLIVWATFFRVNSWKGKEARISFARI